ncbi:MAG TPA: exosporium glycoprotein BclB-related protein [Solirubrobacterales bacterium]|jgi:BclB C-terminal domain-containing protein|nr:exosporium glycoprotein BclB-related protein [Solirubrobacterales bacterium]
MSIDEREGMDKRPQVLWRRRSVFVGVVLAVMIGSTVSVLAATGSPSAKRYYACIAGHYKTLNLTTAGATCPEGQRKISFGEGERGLKGAAGLKGTAGSKGAIGAAGPEGKVGAVGPEGKPGPEGKQGPPGTGGGSPGPEGKEGPQGPTGPVGTVGPAGPQGNVGPQGNQGPVGPAGGGSIVYAASSGAEVALTTIAGGLAGQVAVLPLDGDQAGSAQLVGSALDLTGGSGQIVPAQTFPTNETIESITVFSSTTLAQALVGTTVTVSAQLYTSATPDNTFVPVPGTSVTAAPSLTGVVSIGTVSSGMTTGLSIPVTAGTRGVIVISVTAVGVSLIQTVPMYASASISAS